jgi:hypothetical protein
MCGEISIFKEKQYGEKAYLSGEGAQRHKSTPQQNNTVHHTPTHRNTTAQHAIINSTTQQRNTQRNITTTRQLQLKQSTTQHTTAP